MDSAQTVNDLSAVMDRYAAAGYQVVIPEAVDLPPGAPDVRPHPDAALRAVEREESPAIRATRREELEQQLGEVEHLLGAGQVDLALVLACRAAEGALSRALQRYKRSAYRGSGSELAKLAATFGLLSQEQYALLRSAFARRNEYVHAGERSDVAGPLADERTVREIERTVRGLLA
jgi:hypothetical protein